MDATETIGVGAAIAAVVAILKSAFPQLSGRAIPLVVLGLATLFVVLAAVAGHGGLDVFDVAMRIVGQTAAALGVREGVVSVAPVASSGPAIAATS